MASDDSSAAATSGSLGRHLAILLVFIVAVEAVAMTRVYGVAGAAAVVLHPERLWEPWLQWDAGNYLEIAKFGYHGDPTRVPDQFHGGAALAAFAPLYPILENCLLRLGLIPILCGLIVSIVAMGIAVVGLRTLLTDCGAERYRPLASLVVILIWPASFFLVTGYAQSLLLASGIWAFVFARRRRWLLAGCALAVSFGAQFSAPLAIALLVEYAVRRDSGPLRAREDLLALLKLAVPSLVVWGAWMAYLEATFRDPWAFIDQFGRWLGGQAAHPPWDPIVETLHHLVTLTAWEQPFDWVPLLGTIGLVASLFAAFYWRREEPGWATWCGLSALMFAFTGTSIAIDRWVLPLFPLFVMVARGVVRLRVERRVFAAVVPVAVAVLLIARFVGGTWAG